MSKAVDLLNQLADIGAEIAILNGSRTRDARLVLRAGRLPVPARLIAQIKQNKDEIIKALAGNPDVPRPPTNFRAHTARDWRGLGQGSPTNYTREIADELCRRIEEGRLLKDICQDEDMPKWATVWQWRRRYPDFDAKVIEARKACADALVEDALRIADDASHDTYEQRGRDGSIELAPNLAAVRRSEVMVKQRGWLASRFHPALYGEKQQVEIDQRVTLTAEQVTARLKYLLKEVDYIEVADEPKVLEITATANPGAACTDTDAEKKLKEGDER
jgi:hypothetical protein